MSFGQRNSFPDYGATDSRLAASRNPRTQPGANFDMNSYYQLCDSIGTKIFSINNNVTALEKAAKEVGTQSDSPLLREKIHTTKQSTKLLVTETTKLLKNLTTIVTKGGREHKLQAERVRNEFGATVQRYDTIQKTCDRIVMNRKRTTDDFFSKHTSVNDKTLCEPPDPKKRHECDANSFTEMVIDPKMMQAIVKPQNVWNLDEDEEEQSLIDAEKVQQQQIQEELMFEQGLLIEREERIRQIETDMLDVNKVFLDLAAMVREQGETIGTIEDNITNTAHNVEGGVEQLSKARDYMKSYRNKLCCLVFILLVITVIVAIIVSVSLSS